MEPTPSSILRSFSGAKAVKKRSLKSEMFSSIMVIRSLNRLKRIQLIHAHRILPWGLRKERLLESLGGGMSWSLFRSSLLLLLLLWLLLWLLLLLSLLLSLFFIGEYSRNLSCLCIWNYFINSIGFILSFHLISFNSYHFILFISFIFFEHNSEG